MKPRCYDYHPTVDRTDNRIDDRSTIGPLYRQLQWTPDQNGRGPLRRTRSWARTVKHLKASHPELSNRLIRISNRVGHRLEPLELVRDLPLSYWTGLTHRRDLTQVEKYALFVGYSRSGHSLVGALLNAHPNMVFGQGFNALRYVAAGFRRIQLYGLILRADQRYERRGRTSYKGKYNYGVPGQWQGRYTAIRVIGNKRGEPTTRMLERDPALLERLGRLVGVPVYVIHVIRNPYDNVTAIARRRMSLPEAIKRYFERCATIDRVRQAAPPGRWFDLRHEDLVADAQRAMRELCTFLDVDVDESYVRACASIVRSSPHRARTEADWTPELIAQVAERMTAYRFLDGYSYDEDTL